MLLISLLLALYKQDQTHKMYIQSENNGNNILTRNIVCITHLVKPMNRYEDLKKNNKLSTVRNTSKYKKNLVYKAQKSGQTRGK